MSKDNVKKLFVKMEKDAGLLKKYSELIGSCRNESEKILSEKLIDFGKRSGFEFNSADLRPRAILTARILHSSTKKTADFLLDKSGRDQR